jgi:hypothetical protein
MDCLWSSTSVCARFVKQHHAFSSWLKTLHLVLPFPGQRAGQTIIVGLASAYEYFSWRHAPHEMPTFADE